MKKAFVFRLTALLRTSFAILRISAVAVAMAALCRFLLLLLSCALLIQGRVAKTARVLNIYRVPRPSRTSLPHRCSFLCFLCFRTCLRGNTRPEADAQDNSRACCLREGRDDILHVEWPFCSERRDTVSLLRPDNFPRYFIKSDRPRCLCRGPYSTTMDLDGRELRASSKESKRYLCGIRR